jgi:hypothetical protein
LSRDQLVWLAVSSDSTLTKFNLHLFVGEE